MTNTEIVKQILKELEANHTNLYHDVSKEEVYTYVANIQNLDSLKKHEFDYEMKKMFALFKDAHTSYFIPSYNCRSQSEFKFIGGKIYVFYQDNWQEVEKIGNITADEFINRVEKTINYETKEWLKTQIQESLNNFYTYYMLKLAEDENTLFVTLQDGQRIKVSRKQRNHGVEIKRQTPYSYKILGDKILYVRYSACKEDEAYKFSDFMKDLKKTVRENDIKKYILDVRDNQGKNSEILNPFQEFVGEKNLKGVMLINRGVFSSGRFAVARFKRDFDIPLIGEPTGGAVKSYGYNKNLQVEDKMFSVSTHLWDFSDIFGYEGAIQPDIYVPFTIEDLREGKDSQLKKAIEMFDEEKLEK